MGRIFEKLTVCCYHSNKHYTLQELPKGQLVLAIRERNLCASFLTRLDVKKKKKKVGKCNKFFIIKGQNGYANLFIKRAWIFKG